MTRSIATIQTDPCSCFSRELSLKVVHHLFTARQCIRAATSGHYWNSFCQNNTDSQASTVGLDIKEDLLDQVTILAIFCAVLIQWNKPNNLSID
jgi:hypothetical protein